MRSSLKPRTAFTCLLLVVLLVSPCLGLAQPSDSLEELLGSRTTWGSASIAYSQLNPLFGGIAVYVSGNGDASITRLRRAPGGEMEEVRLNYRLLPSDVFAHFDRLIAAETRAAAIGEDARPPADAGLVTIEIMNAAGEPRTVVAGVLAPVAYEEFMTGLHSVERLVPVATTLMQPLAAGDSPAGFAWATSVASELRDAHWAPHLTQQEREELEANARERDDIQRQLRSNAP